MPVRSVATANLPKLIKQTTPKMQILVKNLIKYGQSRSAILASVREAMDAAEGK